jgi:hypothetical protein
MCKIAQKIINYFTILGRNIMNVSISEQIFEQLKILPQDLQHQVLEFARNLTNSKIKGVPGKELLKFAGSIPKEDLQVMSEAIKQDCDKVDVNEW